MTDTRPERPATRIPVAARFRPDGLAALDAECEREDRTRSDMIRVLCAEAIKARRSRRGS